MGRIFKKKYIAIFLVAKKWRWQSIVKQVLSHKLISSLKRRSLNYLFYNDYETSYTTYINHARWHRCLRSGGLRVGGNRSTWRKPTCLTWWPHDHLICRCRVLNPGRSGERRTLYHYASQTVLILYNVDDKNNYVNLMLRLTYKVHIKVVKILSKCIII